MGFKFNPFTGNLDIAGSAAASAATTGNLTASSPLSVSQTRQLLGGAADLSIDTSSLIPYVGATTNVNLGSRELSTDGSLKVKGSSTDRAGVEIFYNTSTSRGTIISVDRASGATNGLYIASNTLILGCSGGTAFIGHAVNGIDYALVFSGNAGNGTIQWMEDENYFNIPQIISATAVTATALTYINAVGTQTMNTTVPTWWMSGRFRSGTTGATPTDGKSLEIYYSGQFDRGVIRTVDRPSTDKPLQLWGSWVQLNPTGGTAFVGNGADFDQSIIFSGNATQGIINFMEDEDRFDIPTTINASDGVTANSLTIGTEGGVLKSVAGQVSGIGTGTATQYLRGDLSFQTPPYPWGTPSKSFIISNPTTISDSPLWRVPVNINITSMHILCIGGTSCVGQLWNYDENGAGGTTMHSSYVTAAAGTNSSTGLAYGAIVAGHYLGWVTSVVNGPVTRVLVTYEYVET